MLHQKENPSIKNVRSSISKGPEPQARKLHKRTQGSAFNNNRCCNTPGHARSPEKEQAQTSLLPRAQKAKQSIPKKQYGTRKKPLPVRAQRHDLHAGPRLPRFYEPKTPDHPADERYANQYSEQCNICTARNIDRKDTSQRSSSTSAGTEDISFTKIQGQFLEV